MPTAEKEKFSQTTNNNAMTFAGDEIIACPFCNHLYKNIIVTSFNTFGSQSYSDGHIEGDRLPNFVLIVKCKDCEQFFNIKDAEKIGEISKNQPLDTIPEEWKNATKLYGYKISTNELEESLESFFCENQENEIKVRSILLKRYNDVCRKDRKYQFTSKETEKRIKNIERLIEFYKEEDSIDFKILLAEFHREKGDFNSCIEILTEIKGENDNQKTVKEKIYAQAKLKDENVFSIQACAPKKEYQCNNCGDNMILFDLKKMNSSFDYKHYRCIAENKVFNFPSKEKNLTDYYKLTFWKKLFKSKYPYQWVFNKKEIICTTCNKPDVELFKVERRKCIKCEEGNYETVEWFK